MIFYQDLHFLASTALVKILKVAKYFCTTKRWLHDPQNAGHVRDRGK